MSFIFIQLKINRTLKFKKIYTFSYYFLMTTFGLVVLNNLIYVYKLVKNPGRYIYVEYISKIYHALRMLLKSLNLE